MTSKDMMKITTELGLVREAFIDDSVIGYKKARFYKRNDRGYEPESLFVKDLKVGDRLSIDLGTDPEETVSIGEDVAWVIGVWLGDGCMPGQIFDSGKMNTLSVDFGERETDSLSKYLSIVEKWGDQPRVNKHKTSKLVTVYHTGRKSPECFSKIKEFGLWGKNAYTKEIPSIIYSIPKNELASFIGGMWQTDGSFTLKSHGPAKEPGWFAEWSSSSEKMAKAFHELLFTAGIPSTLRQSVPSYVYEGVKKKGQVSYRLSISGNDRLEAFNRIVELYDYKRDHQLMRDRESQNINRGYQRSKGNLYFDRIKKIEAKGDVY